MRRLINLSRLSALLAGCALLLATALPTQAQNDGQFCVRAFDDRNGNGVRDGEPVLTSGVAANLLEANDIVIASALLDESPTASQGIICFQGLAPAQYTIIVASADYRATTPDTLTVVLRPGDLPAVLEFGAQRIDASLPVVDADAAVDTEAVLERLLISVLGALVATLFMLVLGLLIYLLFLRRRRYEALPTPPDAYYSRPPTSESPQVRDTGEYPR